MLSQGFGYLRIECLIDMTPLCLIGVTHKVTHAHSYVFKNHSLKRKKEKDDQHKNPFNEYCE